MNETIITRDKIEALTYRYLCWAKIKVEFSKDDELVPIYVVTGKGIKEVEHKIKVARDTYMSGLAMEKGLFEMEKHTEKLKNFILGGEL